MCEPCSKVTNQRTRKVDELPADTSGGHDGAGKNEIWHRQQREGIELTEHLLCEERHNNFGQQCHPNEADQCNGYENWDTQQHHAQQGGEQERDHGAVTSGGSSLGSRDGSSPKNLRMTTNKRYALPRTIP